MRGAGPPQLSVVEDPLLMVMGSVEFELLRVADPVIGQPEVGILVVVPLAVTSTLLEVVVVKGMVPLPITVDTPLQV